jgi:DNA-binding transcriptional MocR family regulator
VASARGFALVPRGERAVVVLVPPIDGDQASLLALLADGAAWSTSALALALGASQRTVQRALVELEATGRVRSIGRARTALAVAAAGRIHDDLVTPRRAAARVDWSCGAVCEPASTFKTAPARAYTVQGARR